MVYGLVLAAGFGSRLGYEMPKALIPWGERTILDMQLDRLRAAGVEETWIVTGFQAKKLKQHLGKRRGLHFADNPRYMDTQNGKSMLIGLEAIPPGGVVCLNADVVFDAGIIEDVIAEPETTSFAVVPKICGEEEMKYRVAEGRLQAISKQVHGEGEVIGINYISAADRPLLQRALAYNDAGQYYERAFDQMLPFTHRPVRLVPVTTRRAMEIDFPEDLETARGLFAP